MQSQDYHLRELISYVQISQKNKLKIHMLLLRSMIHQDLTSITFHMKVKTDTLQESFYF